MGGARAGRRGRAAAGHARWLAVALLLLAAGCESPLLGGPPANPFAGAWSTKERQQISFRDDTIVVSPAGLPPTALSAASCDGKFRFAYQRRSRDALLATAQRQPDLQRRLAAQLSGAEYPVAELACGDGGTTYVLVSARDLLAIHRDRDIAAIEQLSR